MLDFQDDIAKVFFGTDFAARFRCVRADVEVGEIRGIFGLSDNTALEGRARAAERKLHLPATIDVQLDDLLECLDDMPAQGVPAGTRFKVLERPQRVNDGAEMSVKLGSVKP